MSGFLHRGKLGLDIKVSTPGVIITKSLSENDSIRFVTENAGPTNDILIEMSLDGVNWDFTYNIIGTQNFVLKTELYDIIRISAVTVDGTNVKLLASGFKDGN